MPPTRPDRPNGLLIALTAFALIAAPEPGLSQWAAFNDHAAGPGTHPHATRWNVFGPAAGVPSNTGPLRNIDNGTNLPVTLAIINNNAGAEAIQGNPAPGSPAYFAFNGFVDFDGEPDPSVAIEPGEFVIYRFSGLNPARRYNFAGTAIRGSPSYGNRWTLFELFGASTFTSAHTPNALTNGLTITQVAINTGINNTPDTGDLAVWTGIDPGADGVIEVLSRHYQGDIPGGVADGSKGYGLTGFRLEELPDPNTPVRLTSQPQNTTLLEGETARFTVAAVGYPLFYQWFRNDVTFPGPNGPALILPAVSANDDGATFHVVISNDFSSVTSSIATLTVHPNLATPLFDLQGLWRYLLVGTAPPADWFQPGYDDTLWPIGAAVLGVEDDPYLASLINTPLTLDDTINRRIHTHYFRTTFVVPDPDLFETLTFTNLIDDGAVVYLNGTELYRLNMLDGPVLYRTESRPGVSQAEFELRHTSASLLVPGLNHLAVEVHQHTPGSTDIVLGLSIDGRPAGFGRPAIRPLPPRVDRAIGSDLTLNAKATGRPPLHYQWQRDGTDLADDARYSGTSEPTLSITGIQFGDEGVYTLIVSNDFGAIASTEVLFGVNTVVFTPVLDDIIVNVGVRSEGTAWADYDGNGYLDLFLSSSGGGVRLYRNDGGTFTESTPAAISAVFPTASCGVWGDYDNDDDPDLFISSYDASLTSWLFRNDGGGNFTRIIQNDMAADLSESWRQVTWVDYDLDGRLDLFLVRWNGPRRLYRNRGDGFFERVTGSALLSQFGMDETCAWADYDNDGDPDVFIGNYNGVDSLYRNDGDGQFVRVVTGSIGAEAGVSRGCDWGDYDNDGDPDLFVCESGAGAYRNRLYRNNGDGTFTKITSGAIVEEGDEFTGCAWGDYDNDGDLDLFVSTNDYEDNLLYLNNGDGTFRRIRIGAPVNDPADAHGCTWVDYDRDGDLDLFLAQWVMRNDLLYRNEGNSNAWVQIRCVGTASNRSAIGAKVRILATINGDSVWQMREISGGDGFSSQQTLPAEFGLGDAASIDRVRINWPSGSVTDLATAPLREFLTVTESSVRIVAETFVAIRGFDFTMTVEGIEGSPIQWLFEGAEITGETNAVLTLNNVSPSHTGGYQVTVFGTNGTVTTPPFTLSVREPLLFDIVSPGAIRLINKRLFLLAVGISESATSLILESSVNLTDWIPVRTNAVLGASQRVSVDITNSVQFFRLRESP